MLEGRFDGHLGGKHQSEDVAVGDATGLDPETVKVVIVIGGVDLHVVLVAAPKHEVVGEVGCHDVAPAATGRVDEGVILGL